MDISFIVIFFQPFKNVVPLSFWSPLFLKKSWQSLIPWFSYMWCVILLWLHSRFSFSFWFAAIWLWYYLLRIFLVEIVWGSWFCTFIFFNKLLSHIFFQVQSHLLLFLEIWFTYIRFFSIVSQYREVFFFQFNLHLCCSLFLRVDNFDCCIWSSVTFIISKLLLSPHSIFKISDIIFVFFSDIPYLFKHYEHIFSYILEHSITAALKSSANPNIWVITRLVFIDYLFL